MRNRCVSMLLAIVMALALLPGTALAEEEEAEKIAYPVTGGNIYITYDIMGDHVRWGDDFEEEMYYVCDCDHSVTEAIIPSQVEGHTITGIDHDAFSFCSKLTSLSIPASITKIFPFRECDNLSQIIVDKNNPNYTAEGGVLYNKDKTEFVCCPSVDDAYVIPEGVTSIGPDAFNLCTDLTSVTLPDSLISIGASAFENCYEMANVTFPKSLRNIGEAAFRACSMANVTLPDSLISIGEYAFYCCDNLSSVIVPASVTDIAGNAFGICPNLSEITVAPSNVNYMAESGVLFSKDKAKLIAYPAASGEYRIPEGVTSIGNDAFIYCDALTSLVCPDSLTSIGEWAFSSCENLKTIILSDHLVSIGDDAFSGCSSLTTVTFPASLMTIGMSAFDECTGLTSVVFPNSLISIDRNAFEGCTNLTSVSFPASLTSIGKFAFCDSEKLSDVYYAGTESQWKAIEIDEFNEELLAATIHYNSTGPDAADTPSTPATPSTTAPSFTDVKSGAYYAAPVAWAVEQEITSGTGNNQFSPGRTCNVSEILTFLWRAAGKPEPTVENPFTDVKESNFYYKPALWAYEKGMVTGSTFNPSAVCTRAMAVTFIWQASDSPAADAASFTDVPTDSSYAAAVAWAVANGVTEGVGNGQFNPTGTCTRGQIVTFLYRAFAE